MTELRIRRRIPAPPDRVWRALTDADELIAWFWPDSWRTVGDIDLVVGGRYRIASPVSGMAITGEYVALQPPHRLVQTWRWDGEERETLVTTTLDEDGDGTVLTIVHERFDDDLAAVTHTQGWNDCLDRLTPHLTVPS